MRYDHGMDDDDTLRPPPPEWLEAMVESDAELAAGLTVPLEPVLARLRESLEWMEARQKAKAVHKA